MNESISMYQGEDINLKAQILRDKQSKAASLKIDISDEWMLYAGNSVENIDFVTPILKGKGEGVFPLNVSLTTRSYFGLVTPIGKSILAERHLPMSGSYNFRDLGGIKTTAGRYIKWGKLFRADDMSNLTSEDLTYLSSIPITSVIDFRAESESKRSPDKLPHTARFTYPISITPGNLSSEGIQANLLKANVNIHMKHMNRLLVSDPACVRAFRILFAIVQNNLSAPLAFHCSAGKDRAGMGAALILSALGVDEATIMQDYLSSNIYLEDKYANIINKYPRSEPIFTAKRMFLQAGINQIKRDHGTVMNFLIKELKVDIVRMRRIYLDK